MSVFRTFLSVLCVQVVVFYVVGQGQSALEMHDDGKAQYQLLQERGRLPRYGECWQAAVGRVDEGCRFLSEETQSDIALHITNCFLAMSGHEVYNCELDKKPNLRGICINSMSDRAFNVYTEFYTHTQNICWFLRGQLWQDRLTELTTQASAKLRQTLQQQEALLEQQRLGLQLQERLLGYGERLEKLLDESRLQAAVVIEEIRVSTLKHHHLLTTVADSLGDLKSWLVGEISWVDTVLFYVSAVFLAVLFTASCRSSDARLPMLTVLSLNVVSERLLVATCSDLAQLQLGIWLLRRLALLLSALLLVRTVRNYKDAGAAHRQLLLHIHKQNEEIRNILEARSSSPAQRYNLRRRLEIANVRAQA